MVNRKQAQRRWVAGLAMLAMFGLFVTVAFAQDDSGAASAPTCGAEQVTAVLLEKKSNVSVVKLGQSLVYTVSLNNPRATSDTVKVVTDTLPIGLTFEKMLDTGDVYTPPQINNRTLTWNDPIIIPGGESRSLVYQVRAGELGLKENSAQAETIGGCLTAEVSTSVTVNPIRVYLPLVAKIPSVVFLEDTFDRGLSPDYVVFTNSPGLSKNDWSWGGSAPTWGWYFYNPVDGSGWEGWALSMYLGSGAQDWTDYQVVTTIRDYDKKLAGLWVRGTYEPRTDMQGGQVGGYYVHIKPQDSNVYLWRIKPQTLHYADADVVAQANYPPGISTRKWYSLKVAVQGANIKVWMKAQGEPETAYRLLINWTDANKTYMKGTVGFTAFRTIVFYNDILVTRVSTETP